MGSEKWEVGSVEKMKFIIPDKLLAYKRELELIFKLFKKDNDELIFIDAMMKRDFATIDDIYIDLDYRIEHEQCKVIVEGRTTIFGKEVCFLKEKSIGATDKQTNINLKQAISNVWLRILEEVTNDKHDWGILTGIRPTKLYHKLYRDGGHEYAANYLKEETLLKENKIALLKDVVDRQLKVIPDLYDLGNEVSLYIGVPFCPTKCAYCTFPAYGINYLNNTVDPFLHSLHREIELIGQWLKETEIKVTTIYFGGGTPTSIEAEQIDAIFRVLAKWIDLGQVREITVEAGRPDTITSEKLEVLTWWNVDRISINPQTFTQETLDIIGRDHSVAEVIDKFKLARKHSIKNINMDLIIGLPGENLDNLKVSLDYLAELQPESLTIHTMAFKRTSYLTLNKEEFALTEPEEIKQMMGYSFKWTEEHHYYPYYLYRQKNMLGNLENIGYAEKGNESLYNILIMEEKQTIIGLGSGAVSKLVDPKTGEIQSLPNPKEPNTYVNKAEIVALKKIELLNKIFNN